MKLFMCQYFEQMCLSTSFICSNVVAFRVYDVDGDGTISRKDLRTTLLLVAGDKLRDEKLDDVR